MDRLPNGTKVYIVGKTIGNSFEDKLMPIYYKDNMSVLCSYKTNLLR